MCAKYTKTGWHEPFGATVEKNYPFLEYSAGMYQRACHTISEVFTTGWRKKKKAFCDNLQHDDMKRPSLSFWQRRRNTKVNRSIAIFPSSEFEPIYIRSQLAEIIAKPRNRINAQSSLSNWCFPEVSVVVYYTLSCEHLQTISTLVMGEGGGGRLV